MLPSLNKVIIITIIITGAMPCDTREGPTWLSGMVFDS